MHMMNPAGARENIKAEKKVLHYVCMLLLRSCEDSPERETDSISSADDPVCSQVTV